MMVPLASFFFVNHFKLVDGLSRPLPPLCLSKLIRICKIATGNFVSSLYLHLCSMRYSNLVPLCPSHRLHPTPAPLTRSFSHSVPFPLIYGSLCASLSHLKEVTTLKLTSEPNAETNSAPLIYSLLQSKCCLHFGSHIPLL